MQVEIFSLCDFAQENLGKLTVVGTFDTLNSPMFPFVLPACSVAMRARFSRAEAGKHHFEVSFVDEDGKSFLQELKVDADVKIPAGQDSATLQLCLGIGQLLIPKPGKYSIDLVMDGRQELSLPLLAVSQPMPKAVTRA